MEKILLNIPLRSIICTIYTTSENHSFFKELNLNNDIYLNINNRDYFSSDVLHFKKFIEVLNKSSLRQFAYKLLKPILKLRSLQLTSTHQKNYRSEKLSEDICLLKSYLKKFKYNYRRYFFLKHGNYENLPTNKELNATAIKSLFVIIGI